MIFLQFVVLFLCWSLLPGSSSYLVVQKKNISVRGNTSVGSFDCKFEKQKRDTLFLSSSGHSKPYQFNIPVEVFQCGNFLLNKDFQKTLKANEFPDISVGVKNIKKNPMGEICGDLQLTIAGKTNKMGLIHFNKIKKGKETKLSSEITLLISDFDLTPPKRFGGLIQADDIMFIDVELVLE